MPTFRRFTVVPNLPPALAALEELAYNLRWCWASEAHELFVRMDPNLWEEVYGNPIELISRVGQERLEVLAADDAFLSHLARASDGLREYLSQRGWFERTFPAAAQKKIAYFSMEFGLHESLPIYSGGLGILAGDHLKSASDLGLPLCGIGLAYAEGYFRQVLADDGWQQERYPLNDWSRLPVQPVTLPSGERLVIHVQYPHGMVHAQMWRVQVGRVPLYLLDANVPENSPDDRQITGPLYGGDQEFRVRQEIMLGIGGIHALSALGITPDVCHMNEGHSAFLALERIRRVMEASGTTFTVAREAAAAATVFTTHTPVPAGNDAFAPELVRRYLEPYRAALGISDDELLGLGRQKPDDRTSNFSMPVLAMHTATRQNGVSELHGEVSRRMWKDLWPDVPEHEVPVDFVTNGVHVPSWVCDDLAVLFTRYLGPSWTERLDDRELWKRVQEIPDAELWAAHGHRRHRLVALCRKRLTATAQRRGASRDELSAALEALDPNALTIGFARRFATYKRANLLFSDLSRVKRLLGDAERPVQLVFAGKAHPQDRGGKELIRSIVRASREVGLRGRVVFIENYDMRVARALVSGVDVWLNTPRRPLEASGTSGMKAAANGALNLSILDGWWAEAWRDHGWPVGWAVGNGEEYTDEAGDKVEADALYDLIEREVVPLFFERGDDRLPRRWIAKMKAAIGKITPEYNTMRMVKEYTARFYVPATQIAAELNDNGLAGAKALAAWKVSTTAAWPSVAVTDVRLDKGSVRVGENLRVTAKVELGKLTPNDVLVQIYHGETEGALTVKTGSTTAMTFVTPTGASAGAVSTVHEFEGTIGASRSGTHAVAIRVLPKHAGLVTPFQSGLLRWE